MPWYSYVLFAIFVGAVAVAWYGIAARIVRENTRKDLERIEMYPSEGQLLGLTLEHTDDERVRKATGELNASELGQAIDEIRSDVGEPDESAS